MTTYFYERFCRSERNVPFKVVACAAILTSLLGGTIAAEPNEQIGSWTLACDDQQRPTTKSCDISQSVVDRSVKLSATVALNFDAVANTYLRIITPRSVELTRGVIIGANGEQIMNLRFKRCNNIGCIAEQVLSPNEIISISERTEGEVVLHVSEDKGYSLPVNFAELPAAFERLAKRTGIRYSAYLPADHPDKVLRVVFSGVLPTPRGQATVCTSEATITSNAVLKSESTRVLDAKLENVKNCGGSRTQIVDINSGSQTDSKPEQAVADYLYGKGVDMVRLSHDGIYETLVVGQD